MTVGVGEWISRFHYKEDSEHSDGQKAFADTALETSPCRRPRKRLKRAASPVIDSPLTQSSPPHFSATRGDKLAPSASGCEDSCPHELSAPHNARLDETGSPESGDVGDPTMQDDLSLDSSDADGENALGHCLSISSFLTDHLVKAFAPDPAITTENELEYIRSLIGHGRTAITKAPGSATSRIVKELEALKYPLYSPLKEYQLVGVIWLLTLHQQHHYGILADDMGLGKTAQAITFLRLAYISRKNIQCPSVVICPATLVDNWMAEFLRWAPELRVVKYRGTQKERCDIIRLVERDWDDQQSSVNVVIASLQSVSNRWDRHSFFKRYHFGYAIVDEAHNLKNNETQLHKHLKKSISCDHRLLLTGSPIQNEISELQNLLLLLLPSTVNRHCLRRAMDQFRQHQHLSRSPNSLPQEKGKHENDGLPDDSASPFCCENLACSHFEDRPSLSPEIQCLQAIASPFILRRLKSEVMNDLPPKSSVIHRCPLDGRQKELYKKEIAQATSLMGKDLYELFKKGDTDTNDTEDELSQQTLQLSSLKTPQHIRNLLFRLRRICNHALLYRGYYGPQAVDKLLNYYQQQAVREGKSHLLERLRNDIEKWSDYDIHKAASEISTLRELRLPPEEFLESAKIRCMLTIVDSRKAAGSKVLVFSQFTTFLDIIETTLELHRPAVKFCRMDGNTSIAERQVLTTAFSSDPDVCVFLLSTKAAGVGLNLTAADSVILMDQDWNPHNDRQAEDRVHRIGQTRPVTIFRLCCQDTLEENIIEIGQRKLHLDRAFGGTSDYYYTRAILMGCLEDTGIVAGDKHIQPNQKNFVEDRQEQEHSVTEPMNVTDDSTDASPSTTAINSSSRELSTQAHDTNEYLPFDRLTEKKSSLVELTKGTSQVRTRDATEKGKVYLQHNIKATEQQKKTRKRTAPTQPASVSRKLEEIWSSPAIVL